MQWLLDLITKHTKDGVLDTDALTKEINTEFPKHAVPKSDFNTVNEQFKLKGLSPVQYRIQSLVAA